jgi:hypothetical protein
MDRIECPLTVHFQPQTTEASGIRWNSPDGIVPVQSDILAPDETP